MNKSYINNLETRKIELHFEKEEYLNLSDDIKKEIKSSFLFSRVSGAWVSRSKNNHYSALRVAAKLGFTVEEVKGSRLSYEEELNAKAEIAEAKIERYEEYANNANNRGENLQKDFNSVRGDIAFITQPNISSSSGRSFTNRRNKIMDRYNKGFSEYKKSNYFMEKAAAAKNTAEKTGLKNKVYLCNRIKECKKAIKQYEGYIIVCEEKISNGDPAAAARIEKYLTELEYYIEKQAFMENCLDDLGGIFSKSDIKVGYHIKARHGWMKVKKVNTKTVLAEYIEKNGLLGLTGQCEYSEIKEIKIPQDFQDKKEGLINPYNVGDILVKRSYAGDRVIGAYQVIKKTDKSVTIQELNLNDDRTPIKDGFKVSKPCLKKITKSNYSNYIGITIDDMHVSIYA